MRAAAHTAHVVIAHLVVVVFGASVAHADWSARQRHRVTPVVEVVDAARPAVVNIAATHVVTEAASPFDFFDLPHERKTSSVGSGSVIHELGYVLTNAHVVAQASELSVTTAQGRTWPAHVVAALPEEDIALVKVELPRGVRLPALRLGRTDDVMVGETVVAIGNPVGLGHTVTTGIISAVDRELRPRANIVLTGLLQTDAAINPGNSGGPLLNVVGEQIGVNTAIRGDAQNVGFALPIDRVRALLPSLLAIENRVSEDGARLRLGVVLDVTVVGDQEVVVVRSVQRGSPAAAVGIEPGSVLVAVDGHGDNAVDILVRIAEHPPGRPLAMRLRLPEGSLDDVRPVIEALPPPDGRALAAERLGLTLVDLDPGNALRLGIRGGLAVKAVDGPAKAAGIQPGDLVVRVGRFGVRRAADLLMLEAVKSGDAVPLRVVRLAKGRVWAAEVVLVAR